MKGTIYLYVSKEPPYSSGSGVAKVLGRVASRKETPKYNEVEFKISLEIPDELFEKPTYEAQLVLKSSKVASVPKLEIKTDAVEAWLEGKNK